MQSLLNTMRSQAQLIHGSLARTRIAVVTSYDPANYAAKVKIVPEEYETGWLPVVSPWVGADWGMYAPVSPGDIVEIQFVEGSIENGFICQRFWNDNTRPLTVQSGEFWLVHKSGSALKFLNDGSVILSANTAITSDSPVWNHSGDMNVTGTITATVDVVADGISTKHHLHPDPQGGNVGEPI